MTTASTRAVVIVGGYGTFGGRLARLLIERGGFRVIVAGRSQRRARDFCAAHGGEPAVFDRRRDGEDALRRLAPLAVIDAAGPFQAYGPDPYRLARAALAVGSHYLDLADDAGFVAGIVALDAQARTAGLAVLSGASSVPAISSSAVAALCEGLESLQWIESVILPGNRAPRGLSLVRAIVGQAGRPLRLYRGGAWSELPAWGGLAREVLQIRGVPPLSPRWSSRIGAPDLRLFPGYFRARSVRFRAGLELSVLHLGLWLLAWPVRRGWIASLAPLARPLRWLARRLQRCGSDRGGMAVRVVGIDRAGQAWRRCWTLIAERGEGPAIPAIPAFCLVQRLSQGAVAAGARPCLAELTLDEIQAALARLAVRTGRDETRATTLYQDILGPAWTTLPAPIRRLHTVHDLEIFKGEAEVFTGGGPIGGLIRACLGFPPAHARLPLTVTLERRGAAERWTRSFGKWRFASSLHAAPGKIPGRIVERFGPLSLLMRVPADAAGLHMPIERAFLLGVPLPRWLTPASNAVESVDAAGRFTFDVEVRQPLVGRIVRYRGWLEPAAAEPA